VLKPATNIAGCAGNSASLYTFPGFFLFCRPARPAGNGAPQSLPTCSCKANSPPEIQTSSECSKCCVMVAATEGQLSSTGRRMPRPSTNIQSAGAGEKGPEAIVCGLHVLGMPLLRRLNWRSIARKTNAVNAPQIKCPTAEGRRVAAALGRQSISPVDRRGSSVMGPAYHHIKPKSHPQPIPTPMFDASSRSRRPKFMPIRALTNKCSSKLSTRM